MERKQRFRDPFKSLEFVPLKVIRPDKRRSSANPPDTTLKELPQDLFPSIMERILMCIAYFTSVIKKSLKVKKKMCPCSVVVPSVKRPHIRPWRNDVGWE